VHRRLGGLQLEKRRVERGHVLDELLGLLDLSALPASLATLLDLGDLALGLAHLVGFVLAV
jgi:hypothetical protein